MNNALQSLIQTGTKLYLDSVDPIWSPRIFAWGAVGATSNPVIISGLLGSGRFDEQLSQFDGSVSDAEVAWKLTDSLVKISAKSLSSDVEGKPRQCRMVSFELDPLIEDPDLNLPHDVRLLATSN